VDGALESNFSERYAADFQSRLEVVKPLDEMNGSLPFARPAVGAAESGASYSHKLDTTSVLLTKLGIQPPDRYSGEGRCCDANGRAYFSGA
jgi:hypothetical protein